VHKDKLNKEIGAREQEIKHQIELEEKLNIKKEEYNFKNKECEKWKKLSDLIGSKDGDKFRKFAQGLTLDHLIILSNRHLKNLSGRYFLKRREKTDLELEVIDTFQADSKRYTNTLSGGESFLVSLAMSLGLSDLASKKAKIESYKNLNPPLENCTNLEKERLDEKLSPTTRY